MSTIASESSKGSTVAATEETKSSYVSSGKDTQVAQGTKTQVVIERDSGTQVVCKGDGEYLKGDRGDAATVRVGNVKSADTAEVIGRGTTSDLILDFVLPKGDQGEQGLKGDRGEPGQKGDGIQGGTGDPGDSLFSWVKYAPTNDTNINDMQDDPTGMTWIGVSYNNTYPENEDPDSNIKSRYSWSKIQGEDGNNGNDGSTGPQGPQGENGVSLIYIGEWDGENHPTDNDLPLYSGGADSPLRDGYWYLNISNGERGGNTYVYYEGWYRMTESGGEGPAGPQGSPGGGVQWKGELSSAPNAPEINWVYKNTGHDKYYIHDGYDWATMTSDGNTTPEGVPGGNGVYVFITYHDDQSEPSRPVTDGDDNGDGWFTDPNLPYTLDDNDEFIKDRINWISQKHGTDRNSGSWTDPIAITSNIRGPVGHRGSTSIMVAVDSWTSGQWDDQLAGQACSGGSPTEWDIVTIYDINDPEEQTTKRWGHNTQLNAWEWLDYNYVFLGDVLVDGTVSANKVETGFIDAFEIKADNITTGSLDAGTVNIANLTTEDLTVTEGFKVPLDSIVPEMIDSSWRDSILLGTPDETEGASTVTREPLLEEDTTDTHTFGNLYVDDKKARIKLSFDAPLIAYVSRGSAGSSRFYDVDITFKRGSTVLLEETVRCTHKQTGDWSPVYFNSTIDYEEELEEGTYSYSVEGVFRCNTSYTLKGMRGGTAALVTVPTITSYTIDRNSDFITGLYVEGRSVYGSNSSYVNVWEGSSQTVSGAAIDSYSGFDITLEPGLYYLEVAGLYASSDDHFLATLYLTSELLDTGDSPSIVYGDASSGTVKYDRVVESLGRFTALDGEYRIKRISRVGS